MVVTWLAHLLGIHLTVSVLAGSGLLVRVVGFLGVLAGSGSLALTLGAHLGR